MGSKISVFVIVLVMVVLAGLVTDVPQKNIKDSLDSKEFKTYKETEEDVGVQSDFLFENYPTEGERYGGDLAEVDFSTNSLAKNFKDIINRNRESAGVNFAADYSLITWSCGSRCQSSIVIDARDGLINAYGIISAYGLSFSKDSTLLVINPPENIPDNRDSEILMETDYYSLIDSNLEFQGKEIEGKRVLEDCIQAVTHARNKITNEMVEFSTPCSVPFGWELVP